MAGWTDRGDRDATGRSVRNWPGVNGWSGRRDGGGGWEPRYGLVVLSGRTSWPSFLNSRAQWCAVAHASMPTRHGCKPASRQRDKFVPSCRGRRF